MTQTLLLVAHPGHELLLHGWLRESKPVVHVLTDGSGRSDSPRLDVTRELLRGAGAREGAVFGRLSDREAYAMILDRNAPLLLWIVEELAAAMAEQQPGVVVCDAVEGYNPIHDLCRVIAGAAIEISGVAATQYEYAVVGYPAPGETAPNTLVVELDDEQHAEKIAAARRHAARITDIGDLLSRHGAEAYRREVCRPVDVWRDLGHGAQPLYERIGEARVAAGDYPRVLRRDEHLAPLRDALCAAAGKRTAGERTCAF